MRAPPSSSFKRTSSAAEMPYRLAMLATVSLDCTLRISADEHRSLDGGAEVLGLVAKDPSPRQLPEVAGAERLHGPEDLHLAGVVAGLRELPRAEERVEVAEIASGRHGGLLRIEALVHPAIDAKPMEPGGRGHELPEPLGPSPGNCHGVEAALDHGREHQVFGQPLAPEHPLDHLGVAAGALDPALDHRPTAACLEPLQKVPDLWD